MHATEERARRRGEGPVHDVRMMMRLPEALLEDVRRVAAANDRSAAAEVRVALRRHLKHESHVPGRDEGAKPGAPVQDQAFEEPDRVSVYP